jgi:predicted esterase
MLRRNFRLAGVVGLSTYLPLRSRPPLISAANEDVPVFCGHGTADEVVSRSIGEQSYQALKDAGANIKVEVVPGMGHEVWPGELSAVKTFLAGCVSPTVS